MVEKSKKRIYYTIGNLNYYKSSFDELVLQLPYKYKDEKKEAKKTLAYLEDSPEISHLTPNLIGDKFKISWLREAMDKVTSPKESLDKKAINDRLPEFIFDASKAEEVFADLDVESEESRTLEKHELLTLNASQRKAVLTALHAEDLALLQGPPGTGKTTVIAEMIWQLVRQKQNQRILLTSETNLAVDNALDRLLNPQHTLVKPIRFGRSSKFEEEGKRYSVERITKWLGSKEDDLEVYDEPSLGEETEEEDIAKEDFSNNAIQIWMNRIAGNADRRNEKYADIIKDWTMDLAQPTTEMKSVFKNTYFKYANVIGSTSSSAGSSNFGA
ncbi:MAG: AAA domain-containing protein, partial [Saprospiraceae bacterium]